MQHAATVKGMRYQRIHYACTQLINAIDPEPRREGLAETPERMAAAWQEWTGGYGVDPADVLKCFIHTGPCDQMVIVRDIGFFSHCEHHLAPFFGTATLAYIPQDKIVGLSKLPKLVDIFARRLQVQERLTDQIADAMWQHLQPRGVGVIVRARHMCVESRGVCRQGLETITSALRGAIFELGPARAEFMSLSRA